MKKQSLTEEINRIKEIFNFETPEIIEEQLWKTLIKNVAPNLEKQFFASIESKLGKKIAQASDKEIETAIKSAELKGIRMEIANKIYNSEKKVINKILNKYDLTDRAQAAQAFTELVDTGINKGFKNDIVALAKAAKQKSIDAAQKRAASATTPKPTTAAVNPKTTLSIPDIETLVTNSAVFPEQELLARLNSRFPKGNKKDLLKMVSNLKDANFKAQKDFDRAYTEAVKAYDPLYQQYLQDPSWKKRMVTEYSKLGKYGKFIFWAIAAPGGYQLLQTLGLPVEGLSGWVINSWKNIAKEQGKGVVKKVGGSETSNDSTSNVEAKYQNSIDGFKTYVSDNGIDAANAISLSGGVYKTKNNAIVDYQFVEKDDTTHLGTFEAK